MLVTRVVGADHEEKLAQVERIVGSEILHGSESLCKLLRYMAERCLAHPGTGLKEYQIGTELFGRSVDFDPRMDATVRVQMGRLRTKLTEYYAHAGAGDPWIVEVPKGAYSLVFCPRTAPGPTTEAVVAAPVTLPELPSSQPPPARQRPWQLAVIALSVALALCATALVALLVSQANSKALGVMEPPPGALRFFWHDFVDTPSEPWVIFSNAEFVGRPETGMHYFNPAVDKTQPILDHYSGVGEVLAIHELDQVFTSLHHGLRVKRGRLLSLDDAKNNDLIFVGSPSENLSLREISTAQDFVFKRVESGPRKGDLSIANVRPRQGENNVYLGTAELPIAEDYAVVGLMPGLNPSNWVMLLAGITTIGTQAAVEYVSKPNTVEDLLKRISGSPSGKVAPFEAVLRIKVTHGVPVQSEVVALHLRH